jgi:hypothetical protein
VWDSVSNLGEALDKRAQHIPRMLLNGTEVNLDAGTRVGTLKACHEVAAKFLPQVYGLSREIYEPRLGGAGQGDMKVVRHHCLISTGRKDGSEIDLEELGEVDGPIVLLQHERAKLRWPSHHAEC